MRYDLGVWTSPLPRNDAEAGEVFARVIELIERDDGSLPTAPLSSFARDLLTHWPGLDVWATAEGMRVEVTEEPERVGHLVARVAVLARAQGMVCYDPQQGRRIA
jgi:hypothetical protein